jgi:hypothetical protein
VQVFLLYTTLAAHAAATEADNAFRGLGAVNSKQDILTLVIELDLPPEKPTTQNSKTKSKTTRFTPKKDLEIQLHQDKTALRSRVGDTGISYWFASLSETNNNCYRMPAR